VSGTAQPRDSAIASNAASTAHPNFTRTSAHSIDERPIPALQWKPTAALFRLIRQSLKELGYFAPHGHRPIFDRDI
jgi:hypothetical protein